MSRSVDLFIDSPLPIEALAEHLRASTDAQVAPTADPGRWRMVDGSVTADLYEHAYVDDGELWLSRYRYVLSTHMADGVSLLDSSEVLGLRHLAQMLHHPPELSVLLVLDLQYRLPSATGSSGETAGGGAEVASLHDSGAAPPGMSAGLAAEAQSAPWTGGPAQGERP